MALIDKESMTQMVLNMHGYDSKQIGTYQEFEDRKNRIRELLDDIGEDENLERERGVIDLILSKKQLLSFYLVEKEDGTYALPTAIDMRDPSSFETLMLFDELENCLEEILRNNLTKKSDTKLDENLMALLGMLSDAPYERLSDVLSCLLMLTQR